MVDAAADGRNQLSVYLPQVIPQDFSCAPAFRAQLDGQREPRLIRNVDDPSEADLILFTECHQLPSDFRLRTITHSDVARSFPDRVAVYDERDRPWCSLPGIYVSTPERAFHPRWQVAGSYWNFDEPAQRVTPDYVGQMKYLYSFVGSPTHICREALFGLSSPRSYVERIEGFTFYDPSSRMFDERRRRFAEIIFDSTFVLCPRGMGLSSIRLYEVLAAGKVPVIIADGWVPPAGPDWDAFSIRCPESRVESLPAELERREHEGAAMGLKAREAFNQWFATDVVMTRQIEALVTLLGTSRPTDFPRLGIRDGEFWKGLVRHKLGRIRRRLHAPRG